MPASFETIVEQALGLTDEQRGQLVALLLRSLEPDDGEELTSAEWDAAWSAELKRRVRELRDGSVETVDGEVVLAELLEIAKSP